MQYISPIDPHVHLRWNEYSNVIPSFTELAFRDAVAVGLRAIIEQPNTDPYLDTHEHIRNRIKHIDKIRAKVPGARDVHHAISAAITPNIEQVKNILPIIGNDCENGVSRIPCTKTFYAKSTRSGGIEILDDHSSRLVWNEVGHDSGTYITREGHFENEASFKGKFDPSKPETHAKRQNPKAEVIELEKQLNFAHEAGFRGRFVVKHVTNPESIDLGKDFIKKINPGFRLIYEATFHHLFLNIKDDYPLHGNGVKMNPPLRSKKMQEELLKRLLRGEIDTIGTDHAPHPYAQKIGDPYKSGVPEIPFYPKGIELLRKHKINSKLLDNLLFNNANEIYFNNKLKPREVEVEYDPELWKSYGYNPFYRVDGTLKS